MLDFVVIQTAVKHPNQWAGIKLCVKKELIKERLEVMVVIFCNIFYIDLEYDYQN